MRKLFFALLSLTLLLSACAGGSSRPAKGVDYVATGAEGLDLVEGSTASIVFDGGGVGLGTGCNSLSGKATWSGNTLKVGDYAITEIGCEEDLMVQEDILVDLLTNEPTVTRAGEDLTVSGVLSDGAEVTVTFVERQNTPLENTAWELQGLGDETRQTFTALPEGVTSTLAFTDTEVLVEYGCNSGGGTVTIGEDTLTFGDLLTTAMMREHEAMKVENHVTKVLQGKATYTSEGQSLTITKGSNSLQYAPAE